MERIYLSIVSGQFAQWSKEAKNKHFVRVTREDEDGNTIIGKGYRRYFDEAEGKLVKVEERDTDYGVQVNIYLETEKGMFVITLNELTQSGQVTDYLRSFLLSTKSMEVGGYYKIVPYSIKENRDGSERDRALNGITVYEDTDKGFEKIEDKYIVEYINKDGEVETPGEIPGLVFTKGKRKNDKMKVDHEAQTEALLELLDKLIEATEDYELPKSGSYASKSALSAFGDDDEDGYTATGAEAMGIEDDFEEEEEDTPKQETRRVSRTPAKVNRKAVKEEEEEEAEEDEPKSTVDRRPRRTASKKVAEEAEEVEDKPKRTAAKPATKGKKSGLPF